MKRRRIRRALAAVFAVALLSLTAFGVHAWVKSRVRYEIESRCARALRATCSIEGVALGRDGAHARGVHAESEAGTLGADMDRVDIYFRWIPLALSRPQGITVKVFRPALTDQAPLDHVIAEVLALHGTGEGRRLPRGATMRRFEVQEGSIRVPVAPFIAARIEGISLRSERDGRFELGWRDAAVDAGPFTAARSGECTVNRAPGAREARVDCANTHESIDLDTLGSGSGFTWAALRILRSAVGRVPGLP